MRHRRLGEVDLIEARAGKVASVLTPIASVGYIRTREQNTSEEDRVAG